MKTILEILPTVGAERHDVENWLGRLTFSSAFETGTPGRARQFSRDNTIELAAIAAFVRMGWLPNTAVAMAGAVMRMAKVNKVREWAVFSTESPNGYATNVIDMDRIARDVAAASEVPIVRLVPIGEIVRRVDRLFAGVEVG